METDLFINKLITVDVQLIIIIIIRASASQRTSQN